MRRGSPEIRIVVSLGDVGDDERDAVPVDHAVVIALIPDDSVVSGQQKHLAEQQIVRTEDPSHVGVHPRLRSRIGIRLGPKVENFHVPARIRNRHLDQLVVGIDLEVHEQRFDASDAGLDRRCRALDVDRAVDLDDKSDVVDRDCSDRRSEQPTPHAERPSPGALRPDGHHPRQTGELPESGQTSRIRSSSFMLIERRTPSQV